MRTELHEPPAGSPPPALAAPVPWIPRGERLEAARAHIERNLEWGVLTPVATARALGISVRQLHLLFRPTGTTFSRYVLGRRLERARAALLLDPGRKVLEIALSCGIESPTVFYRAFRLAFGVTPTDYRRSPAAGEAGVADAPKRAGPRRSCERAPAG